MTFCSERAHLATLPAARVQMSHRFSSGLDAASVHRCGDWRRLPAATVGKAGPEQRLLRHFLPHLLPE